MTGLKIGVLIPVWTESMGGETPRAKDLFAYTRVAEEVGFDSLWIVDHFFYEP